MDLVGRAFAVCAVPGYVGPATLLNCVDDTGLVLKPYQIIYWPIKWVTGVLRPLQTARNRYLYWCTKSVTDP